MQEFFNFEEIKERVNPRDIGNRALRIGNLYNDGFPVLDGFVISSKMFKEFIVLSGIREKLFCYLKEGKADKIKDLIMRKDVPEVERKIKDYCKKKNIKDGFLNSSSVFDHKFIISAKNDFMEGVKNCWASVFNNKLIEKLNSKNLFSAVIVQNNLGIKKSGFIYTQNPLNRRGHMVVEIVKPKKYYFLIEKENYGSVHLQDFDEMGCPVTENEKQDLASLGKNIESHYKEGYKINWVLGNRFYISNARPLEKRDENYFLSQPTSSALRSRS